MSNPNSCLAKPDGKTKAPPCCCIYNGRHVDAEVTDDITFLRNVAEVVINDVRIETSKRVTIDRNRIYMAGHSKGLIASIAMCMIHSDVVAAVGCHAGVAQAPFPKSPYQPTPMFMVYGTLYPIFPFEEGQKSHSSFFTRPFSALETHNFIAEAKECTIKKTVAVDNGGHPGTKHVFSGCKHNAQVQLLALNDVAHKPNLGHGGGKSTVPVALDTTKLAWKFVSQYSLNKSKSLSCKYSPLQKKQGGG